MIAEGGCRRYLKMVDAKHSGIVYKERKKLVFDVSLKVKDLGA